MAEFKASICLSRIPKEFIRKGADGREYIDIYVARKRKCSPFERSHYVKIDLPSRKYAPIYIGDATEYNVFGDE